MEEEMSAPELWFLGICLALAGILLGVFVYSIIATSVLRSAGVPPGSWRRRWVNALVSASIVAIVGAILYPFFSVPKENGHRRGGCRSNISQLCTALYIYSADNDDRLPPADEWFDLAWGTYGKSKTPLRCTESKSPYTYAFNAYMDGILVTDLEDQSHTIVLFEIEARGPNAFGGSDSEAPPRHRGGNVYGMAECSTRWLKPDARATYKWKPELQDATRSKTKGSPITRRE